MLRPRRVLASLLAAHAPAAGGQTWVGAWVATAAPERGAHRRARAADDEVADKRERRRQRRQANRQLKERVSCGEWQWGSHQARKPQGAAPQEPAEAAEPGNDYELFQAVLGKPRSTAEHRRFSRLWQQWQAAAGRAQRADSSSSSAGASTSSRRGSAGASAGPRWGQANQSWEDFRQEQASSSASGSWSSAGFEFTFNWGDEEAWYEPNSGGSSSRSSRRQGGASGAWSWHGTWQQQQQHPGSSGWQHGGGAGTAGSLQLLGLERSWLSSRCGRLLRRAYLAQAKALHPDVHAGSGQGAAAAAEARFKEVQAAYEALQALAVPGGPPAGPKL